MEGKILRTTEICGLLLAAVFCFIDWRVSAGIALGLVCFSLYFLILNASYRGLTESGNVNGLLMILATIIRLDLMAMPLLAGFLFPQYVNVWGCFGGFMVFKIASVIEAARSARE